ncbi:lasso peptide biosynthesis PqqD family chaperone [Altericista sp. CCNU0014]|uniref:lasso peptide biosynthesis PqqD family chaperone n=1 Tax=Altericista sp. CCNU0014 TaxID=3082949 RepID=UPI00384AA01A
MNKPSPGFLISQNSIVVAAPDQVSSDLAGESVILNLKSGTYYGLNEVGSFVWELIQEPKSVGEIYDTIQQEYEVEAQDCENDVRALLSDLLEAQLVEIRDEAIS